MKLLAIDGNSLINRAYYGVRPLTTKEGVFTNAVYGFSTILLKLLADVQPDCIAVAFDVHKPTFRHAMYDEYKAGRHATPDELLSQFPLVWELLTLWGITTVESEGYEADDILGALARVCRENDGDSCVIATGDRDSLQLVGDGVIVKLAKTTAGKPETAIYDEAAIREQYGVSPKQLIDVKAIMGDASDHIPGVAGIGEKGALALISAFGSLDGVYANIDDPSIKDGIRKKLTDCRDMAYLSRKLAEITTDVPIDLSLDLYRFSPMDMPAMTAFLTKLEMFSLIPKIVTGGDTVVASEIKTKVTITNEIPGSFKTAQKLYCGFGDTVCVTDENAETVAKISPEKFLPIAESKKIYFIDSKPAFGAGVLPQQVAFDATLAAYLLNPSATSYDADRLAAEYGAAIYDNDDADVKTAATLPSLCAVLEKKIIENNQQSLLFDMEIPLAYVLSQMEREGFAIDKAGLSALGEQLSTQIAEYERLIYAQSWQEFNINSPKQLGEILFVKLGLPTRKKTATGFSTDAAVLEELRDTHPIIEYILRYRQLSKLKSTYCDGLLPKIGEDGRLRTTFIQTETRTGRISSVEPNLQNIPTRSETGRELRKFFTAREGWLLVDADYSQIELRVLAHITGDERMCEAFRNDKDIHIITASQVMGLPPEMVTREMRSAAKTVNFSIIYGISAFSLAKDIHTTRKQAEMYIQGYMNTYRGVADYMERAIREAKEKGYAETIFGRRRLLPELAASNFNTRSFGERVARNMPIQGASADIIKMAMIKVSAALERENLRARLILQVHDELIVEAPAEEAERAGEILKYEMEHAYEMRVPLIAEVNIGRTWYECK